MMKCEASRGNPCRKIFELCLRTELCSVVLIYSCISLLKKDDGVTIIYYYISLLNKDERESLLLTLVTFLF